MYTYFEFFVSHPFQNNLLGILRINATIFSSYNNQNQYKRSELCVNRYRQCYTKLPEEEEHWWWTVRENGDEEDWRGRVAVIEIERRGWNIWERSDNVDLEERSGMNNGEIEDEVVGRKTMEVVVVAIFTRLIQIRQLDSIRTVRKIPHFIVFVGFERFLPR